jgi:hypothetical protein
MDQNDNNDPTVDQLMSHTAIKQLKETNSSMNGKYCKKIGCYLSIGEYVCYSGMSIWSPSNYISPAPLAIGLTYEVKSSFGQIVEFCPPRTSGEGKEESLIKVCVSAHHKHLPSGATQDKMLPMTDSFAVYPT